MPTGTVPTYELLIADNENAVLADISGVALDRAVSPRMSSPSLSGFRVPLTPEVLALGSGSDGYPLFWPGLRRLIVRRNGVCVANDKVWRVKPVGQPDDAYLECECVGPMRRWDTRWAQDAGGQVFDGPSADGSDRGLDLPSGIIADPDMTVVAAQMLKEAIDNTVANDGPLEVTTVGGTFSTTPSPGGNVAFSLRNLTPMSLMDLAVEMVQTGVCDILIAPSDGSGETMGVVSAVNRAGADLPGVSFDWGTGANNVAYAYPEASMDGFCNKLIYEIPPRLDPNHFANNVTIDAPGVTTDPSGSQSLYGVYVDYVIEEGLTGAVTNDSNLFKLYVRKWNAELAERMVPIQLINVVPQAGKAPEPWDDYNLGDTPRANLANLELDVSGDSFRILGWDARPENTTGVERVNLQIGWSVE